MFKYFKFQCMTEKSAVISGRGISETRFQKYQNQKPTNITIQLMVFRCHNSKSLGVTVNQKDPF